MGAALTLAHLGHSLSEATVITLRPVRNRVTCQRLPFRHMLLTVAFDAVGGLVHSGYPPRERPGVHSSRRFL
jgi:hypothetical protein